MKKEFVCLNCGKVFVNDIKHGNRERKFCSYPCSHEYKIKHKKVNSFVCEHCGKEFIDENGNKKRRFCSFECFIASGNQKDITFDIDPITGCWICTSHYVSGKFRYPVMYRNNKKIMVHRYMYEQFKGEIPQGKCVCHTCDNPKCINPEHLFIGTHKENMDDMTKKKRYYHAVGSLNGMAKLTDDNVCYIRSHPEMATKELMEKFNVSKATILCVKNRKSYTNVI